MSFEEEFGNNTKGELDKQTSGTAITSSSSNSDIDGNSVTSQETTTKTVRRQEMSDEGDPMVEYGEYGWVISASHIYTKDGFPVFNQDFGTELQTYDSSIIFKFAEALEQFASESLKTDLVGFYINNEFVIVEELEEIFILLNLKVGEKVLVGYETPLINEVARIASEIEQINSLNFTDTMIGDVDLKERAIQDIIESANTQNNTSKQPQITPEFGISMVFITDPDGIPVIARSYDEQNFQEDPILVTTFMHALQVFFSTHIRDDLTKIQFGHQLCHIRQHQDHFYGIVLEVKSNINISASNPLHQISDNLLDKFIQSISMMGDTKDVPYEIMENLSDSFVRESIMDIDNYK